ncbi:coiled-coil domain-containing protein 181 [Microcaecilia unicolor]|uniref:Coiled-coil domain-containing protein 181 n=1 Tax=Microcaecilia unicolor TaxID=1415580 RepID=A0A6P7Y480_9AMPH|nr:coiled-coil domain-containing protein 181 [Microcaecilia unicolor]
MQRGSLLTSILIMDSLSEKDDTGDTDISGEYEDDFERDLDWLIDEEKENFKEPEDDAEIEARIDKELAEFDEKQSSVEVISFDFDESPEKSQSKNYTVPVPDMVSVSDTDSDGSINEIKLENPEELEEQQNVEDEEVKRYIMEKIVKANKQLEDEEPIYEGRERKLKFKDNLVDLEVPPAEFFEGDKNFINNEESVLDGMSQLQISDDPKQEHKEGKVLVERDGKFELVSLQDIESQGFLPPINITPSENGSQIISPRSSQSNVLSSLANNKKEDISIQQSKSTVNLSVEAVMHVPQPPADPNFRPSSVNNMTRNAGKKPSRRVQSANYPPKNTTYCLTTKQKEVQRKSEQRKEQKKKEEEECKRYQEEQKKKENQMAFRAWLQKKKEQLLEQKRIQQAKELEEMNNSYMERDPNAAFKMWLKKKQEEHLKEKEMDELRKQQHNTYFMHKKEDCDRAFRQWLARKRMEKHTEQLIAKERARRFMSEARRAKQIQNLLYNISDNKSFRFTSHYT